MSDPVGYINASVVSMGRVEALGWFDRQVAWERRLEELASPRPPLRDAQAGDPAGDRAA